MTIVSNSSPLRYLIAIEAIDVLPSLFGRVHVSPSVIQELTHTHSPPVVLEWMTNAPNWLTIHREFVSSRIPGLDLGESDSITQAEFLVASLVLMDDKRGRREAERRGLAVVGTLAILELAAMRGMVTFRDVLNRLRTQTNFRMSNELFNKLLKDNE